MRPLSIPLDRTPETFTPSDSLLVDMVRARPCISIREVCQALWPQLPWRPEADGADSAADRLRTFLSLCPRSEEQLTAAAWVRDQLQSLVIRGELRFAPRRRDEVDLEAQLSYVLPVAGRALAPTLRVAKKEAIHV